MSTGSECTDDLPYRHPIADVQIADHRLVRRSDQAVINADDRFAANRSDERYCAAGRCQDRLTGLGAKINTAMTRGPGERRWIEPTLDHRRSTQRPPRRCGQRRDRDGRSRDGEHAQTDCEKDQQPKLSTKDLHVDSLGAQHARIVRAAGNLWTTL
jgi:hypothetical protein